MAMRTVVLDDEERAALHGLIADVVEQSKQPPEKRRYRVWLTWEQLERLTSVLGREGEAAVVATEAHTELAEWPEEQPQ